MSKNNRVRRTRRFASRFLRASLKRRALCLALAINLVILPAPWPALSQAAGGALAGIDDILGVSRLASAALAAIGPRILVVWDMGIPIPIWIGSGGKRQIENPAERVTLVSAIAVNPGRRAAFVGDRIAFTAQPNDTSSAVVHGIKFIWRSLNPDKLSIDEAGRATMLAPGLAAVACTAGTSTGTAIVLIRPGSRPVETDAQWRLEQGSGTAGTGPGGSASLHSPSVDSPSLGPASLGPHPSLRAQVSGGAESSLRASASGAEESSLGALASPEADPSLPPSAPGGAESSFNSQAATRAPSNAASETRGPSLLSSLIDKLAPTAHAQNGGGGGSGAAWTNAAWVIGTPRNGVIEPTRFGAVLPESFNYELSIPIVASLGNRELNLPLVLYYNSNVWSMSDPLTLQFDPNQSWPSPGFSLGFGRIDTVLSGDGVTAYYTLVDPNGTRHYLGSGPAVVNGDSYGNPPPYPTYTTTDGTYISYVGDAVHGGELYYPSGIKYDINLVNNRLQVTQITSTNGNYIQIAYMPYFSPFAINYVIDTLGRQINFAYNNDGTPSSVIGPNGGAVFGYQQRTLSYNFYSDTYGQQMTVEGAPSSYPALAGINALQYYQMNYSDYGMIYGFTMGRNSTTTVTFDYATSGSTQLGGAPAFTQRTETSGTTTGTYSYSINNGVTTITRPDTSTLTLTDNGAGLLAQSEIKLGTHSFAKLVNTYGNDPGGAPQAVTAMSYDDTGTPRRIDYGYDQYGNVTSKLEYGFQVNGPWQRKTTLTYEGVPYTYTTNHLLRLVTGVNVYDTNNNQIAGTSYTHDGISLVTYPQQATAPGHLSTYAGTRGNVTTVTRMTDIAHGTSTSRSASYDVFGNQVQVQLDCCNQKSSTYNQDTYWSQPDQTTSGSGSTTETNSSSYNFNTSATTSTTDPNGLTTNYTNNSWLQPTQISAPGGASFGLGYGDWGDLNATSVSYTDGGVNKSFSASVTKDGWGNPIQQFDRYGNQINLGYDSLGRLSSKTNPFPHNGTPGPATTYQYDVLGRTTVVTMPNGQTVSYRFSGSTVTITDQVGRKKQQQNDGLGRLITVTEQDPGTGQLTLTTSYSYDLLDDLIQVNQAGQIRAFKYDAAKRMLYERLPEQSATINDGTGTMWTCAYTYTNFDGVASRTDARGVVTTYSYDTLNRLTSRSYNLTNAPGVEPTNTVTWTYDTSTTSSTKGLLLSITMTGSLPTYQENFYYDNLNRLSYRTWTRDGQSYTVRYQYNTISQLTQMTYSSGIVINSQYDSLARPSLIVDASGTQYLSNITFNPAGSLIGDKLGNGVTESLGYDNQTLLLTSRTATAPGGATGGLMSLNYSYQAAAGQLGVGTTAGNAGQLVSINNSAINGSAESASYSYDVLGRLLTSTQSSSGMSAQRRFAYDTWGNRTGEWDATSGGNLIQSVTLQQSGGVATNRIQSVSASGTTLGYVYDAAGNLINDGVHSYQYDGENRLRTVDSANTATYAYDYQNRRLLKSVGGVVTHYIWNAGQVLAEHNAATGTVIVIYIYSGNRLIAKKQGTAGYILRDRLSIRVALDPNGNVTGTQAHLPFGEDFAETGQQEKHHFTSYERDSETAADYALNRFSSPGLGRFTTVDQGKSSSAGNPQSLNRYTYALNNPSNLLDPSGLDPFSPGPGGGDPTDPTDPNAGVIRPCGWDPRGPGLLDTGIADELLACQPGSAPPPRPIPATNPTPDPPEECVITVTARPLQGNLGKIGYDHMFITTWDTRSNATVYAGAGPVGGFLGGQLVGRYGLYSPGIAVSGDWNPEVRAQFELVEPGSCDAINSSLASSTARINASNIRYWPIGPNSNSFVYSLLSDAGLTGLTGLIDDWWLANIITGNPSLGSNPIPGWHWSI